MKGKQICKTLKEIKLNIAIGKMAVAAILFIVATSIAPVMAQTQDKSAPEVASSNDIKIIDFAPNDANAIIVKGSVVGKDNEPLTGATIVVLDKYNKLILQGTATEGIDSQFAIRIPKGTKVKIQYVGYKTFIKEFNKPEDNLLIEMEIDEKLEKGNGQFWLLNSTSTK